MKNNMLEIFRRLWPIALVWTLLELVSGPGLIALQRSSDQRRIAMFDYYTMSVGGFFTLVVNVVFTLVVGIAVFRYAHSMKSLSIIHALPIRRRTLFLSSWLSGGIIVAVPQIITSLCLLPFAKLSFAHLFTSARELYAIAYNTRACHADAGDILRFFLLTMVAMLFIYALTVLAGVITGTTALHLIVACILNVIVFAMYSLTYLLSITFLYGFSGGESRIEGYLHPLLLFDRQGMFAGDHAPGALFAVMCVIASLLISGAALFLYTRLKAERVGRAFTFDLAERIMVILVTLACMALGGFFLTSALLPAGEYNMALHKPLFYLGALISAVLAFLISMMVARKTLRIFNLRTLKSFGIYAICAVLFLGCTTTNLTGYEKRLPKPAQVKEAYFRLDGLNIMPYRWGYPQTVLGSGITVSGTESIERLIEVQKLIAQSDRAYETDRGVDNPDLDREVRSVFDYSFHYGSLDFDYDLKHGSMHRRYEVSPKLTETPQFKALIASKAFRENFTIEKLCGYENLKGAQVAYLSYGNYGVSDEELPEKELSPADTRELAKHLDADYRRLNENDLLNQSEAAEITTFHIQYKLPFKTLSFIDGGEMYEDAAFYYSVTDKYLETIVWLKEKGYYDELMQITKQQKESMEAAFADTTQEAVD